MQQKIPGFAQDFDCWKLFLSIVSGVAISSLFETPPQCPIPNAQLKVLHTTEIDLFGRGNANRNATRQVFIEDGLCSFVRPKVEKDKNNCMEDSRLACSSSSATAQGTQTKHTPPRKWSGNCKFPSTMSRYHDSQRHQNNQAYLWGVEGMCKAVKTYLVSPRPPFSKVFAFSFLYVWRNFKKNHFMNILGGLK